MNDRICKVLAVLAMMVGFSSTTQAATNQEIIQNISYNVILATYKDLATKAAELNKAVDVFAANPTQENLNQAQSAWRATRVPWESSEAFLYGPVDSLGIDPSLDMWPLNKMDLLSVLKSGKELNVEFVRNLGTNLQGFHAIEFLLFGDGLQKNNKDLAAFDKSQFEYLRAASFLLADYTAQLTHAWTTRYNPEDSTTPGYVEVISNPGPQNPFYSSERAVLEEYIQGMIAIFDEVANGKMSDPFGSDITQANVELVESPYSWNSLSDLKNNVGSIYNVYTGSYGLKKGPGLRDFVKAKDAVLAKHVELEILKSMKLISKISGPHQDMPFEKAILDVEGRKRVQLAIDQLNKTRTLVEERVLPLLD